VFYEGSIEKGEWLESKSFCSNSGAFKHQREITDSGNAAYVYDRYQFENEGMPTNPPLKWDFEKKKWKGAEVKQTQETNMKHSNIYYIYTRDPEDGSLMFEEVDGTAVKNSYGFDLFRHKVRGKAFEAVSDGLTGYKICEIRPGSANSDYLSSPKDIDSYLGEYHQVDKIYRHEKIRKALDQMREEGKLSPRYTEPYKRRSPKKKE
jgi:hypothetical protein